MNGNTSTIDRTEMVLGGASRTSLWRNRDFMLLWSGQIVSTVGTKVSGLALSLLVLALTGSPLQAGLVAAAGQLPLLALNLPAGALVDRWDRRRVMLLCDGARFLAYASLPLAYLVARVTLPQLYLIALVDGAATALFDNAEVACLPRLVAPADLDRAMGRNASGEAVAELVGPSLGGLVIGLARATLPGVALAYTLDAVSYLASVLSLALIRAPFQAGRGAAPERSLRADIAEGLRYVWAHPSLRALTLLMIGPNLCYGPIYVVIIWLLRHTLHATPLAIGLVLGLESVGSIIGGQVVDMELLGPISPRWRIIGALAVAGAGMIVMAVAVAPWLVAPGVVLAFVGVPVFGATVVGYRMRLTPDALQGRVNSVSRLTMYVALPLGAALGGVMLQTSGARPVLWAAAAGITLTAVAAGRLSVAAPPFPVQPALNSALAPAQCDR